MSSGKNNVQSVTRALLLLETLADDAAGWRLTDLSLRTGLSLSTVHRLLTTLQERRFVQYDSRRQLWSVGRQAFSVGAAFGQRQALVAPALPHLRRLRDLTRETANFGVLDDGEIVVMAQAESREIVRAIARTGGRAGLVNSALGKAVLSAYAEDDMEAVLASPHGRSGPISGQPALRAELATAKALGYAIDNGDGGRGITCVASPVRNGTEDVVGAISVSGLSARMSADRLPVIGAWVAQAALDFSASLSSAARAIRSSREPARQLSNDAPKAGR